MAMETEQTTDGLVIGRNAVAEQLAGGREIGGKRRAHRLHCATGR